MSESYTDAYKRSLSYESTTGFEKVQSVFALDLNGVNYATDLMSFALKSKPMAADRVTFGRYSTGRAAEWSLDIKAIFDGGSLGSLHDFIWTYPGYVTTFIIRPYQEFDPYEKRFYGGTIRIPHHPNIKMKAGSISTFDYSFDVIGTPVRTDQPLGIVTGKVYSEI